ncbi:hypothetical protein [Mycolicibacterium hippocampi]|uniref:hypothetical protein n=1 Tax=Mycolicibacterium hippocampi TaxID=659824 RepID=UPI003515AD19
MDDGIDYCVLPVSALFALLFNGFHFIGQGREGLHCPFDLNELLGRQTFLAAGPAGQR